jgi:hypothetical protein
VKKYYKSTIVIYSESDWSEESLYDLVVDATVAGQVGGSICSTWDIDEIGAKDLELDPNGDAIVEFFTVLSENQDDDPQDYADNISQFIDDIDLDPDPYQPFPEEDYEFYDEGK